MATEKVALAPEKRATRPTLGPVGRAELSFLAGGSVDFSSINISAAQAFYDGMMMARERWLREKGRRLPRPEQLECERYGDDRRGGFRHGR